MVWDSFFCALHIHQTSFAESEILAGAGIWNRSRRFDRRLDFFLICYVQTIDKEVKK